LRRCLKITGPGELSFTPIASTSRIGEISTRIVAARMMSLMRLTTSFTPVNGVSRMPTTGTPFTSCSRPWMMLMPKTSGTKNSEAVVPCSCSSSCRMRGCEPSGSVM